MLLKPLLDNSLRENVRMLVFRREILNRQVPRPHQLAQKVAPYVDVLTDGRAQ